MSYFDDVYERIKLAINVRTQVELAEKLSIKQSSISDAKRRRAIPNEWLIKLYDTYGLNPDWLRWGTGPMAIKEVDEALSPERERAVLPEAPEPPLSGPVLAESQPDELPLARGRLTKVLSPACDYQDGKARPTLDNHSYLVLPEHFVQDGILVFHVDNAGMEPALRKGGYAGVSTISRPLVSGEIYALFMPFEGVAFRRIVQDSEDGYYLLCFEREALPSTRVSARALRDRLVGRVIWTLQTI